MKVPWQVSESSTFQKLLEAMGGSWSEIESDWRGLKTAIENRKPSVNADAIKAQIQEVIDSVNSLAEFPDSSTKDIISILKKASPWGAVKEAGDAAIPAGQPTQQMNQIRAYLKEKGLWIVPVGELEGFCRSIGNHGPKWVQKVIEDRDLSGDPELDAARTFINVIWERLPSVAAPSQENAS